jgi:ribosomal-protein-alanine N-acetyltransferase
VIEPVQLTDEVTLRIVREEDAAAFANAFVKNRDHLARWNPFHPEEFFTEAGQKTEILKQLAAFDAGTSAPWILVSGDVIVGTISLYSITLGPLQSAVLGYWIDVDQTGKGLASRAVGSVIAIARDELGLHRLEAGTMLENHASQRVLAKAGFVEFGLAPKFLFVRDVWEDHRLFQILLHD